MSVFNKLHCSLGLGKTNSKSCGEFEIQTYITDVRIDTSCGCTNASIEGSKLKFCINIGGRQKHLKQNILTKKINITVNYKREGVPLQETLTASVDYKNK